MRKLQADIRKCELFCQRLSERPAAVRYGFATLMVLLAFLLRQGFHLALGEHFPLTFFLTSAIVAAWLGGLGPGLYAIVLGFVLGDYFFLPPIQSIGVYEEAEAMELLGNVLTGLLAISAIALMHRARRRIDYYANELAQARKQIEEHALKLEIQVAQRTSELSQSVEFLQNFCYSIAHNVRAPLRAMHGGAALLEMSSGTKLNEEEKAAMGMIKEGSERMDKMINVLLLYGRLSHATVSLVPIPAASFVKGIVISMKSDVEKAGAEIHIEESPLELQADRKLLAIALQSILRNALKFHSGATAPVVNVCMEGRQDRIKIWIKDNGLGIDPRYQHKIFSLFERLDTDSEIGIGSGLAIASKALERMGGSIGVVSDLGKGACFWLELKKA
ncbi:sensor histidine kinase [Pedosphaera parvula]|uniref:histidine kinase n=1 Tax=Pedosphaera parvula (strain Ellin514) TaxID=320771 RepID=B9XJB0_PEDPL|nr:PAS domain-containing sensor histidine kinase [Pedosphaera parvula]EEF60148.1 integral membrane sensor signal transduction histidine kinase [Pedosphaera parvula Ellin514]